MRTGTSMPARTNYSNTMLEQPKRGKSLRTIILGLHKEVFAGHQVEGLPGAATHFCELRAHCLPGRDGLRRMRQVRYQTLDPGQIACTGWLPASQIRFGNAQE